LLASLSSQNVTDVAGLTVMPCRPAWKPSNSRSGQAVDEADLNIDNQ
jgi:hypothetical protein